MCRLRPGQGPVVNRPLRSPLCPPSPLAPLPPLSLSVRRRSPVVAILQLGAAIPMDGRTAMRRVGPAGGRPGGRPGDRDRPRRVFLRRSHRPQEGKPGERGRQKVGPLSVSSYGVLRKNLAALALPQRLNLGLGRTRAQYFDCRPAATSFDHWCCRPAFTPLSLGSM